VEVQRDLLAQDLGPNGEVVLGDCGCTVQAGIVSAPSQNSRMCGSDSLLMLVKIVSLSSVVSLRRFCLLVLRLSLQDRQGACFQQALWCILQILLIMA
jgi:hypothetical protein